MAEGEKRPPLPELGCHPTDAEEVQPKSRHTVPEFHPRIANLEETKPKVKKTHPELHNCNVKAEEVKAKIENSPPKSRQRMHSVEVLKCDFPNTEPDSVRVFYTEAAFSEPNAIHISRRFLHKAAKTLFENAAFRFESADVFRKFYLTVNIELLKISNSFTIMGLGAVRSYEGRRLVEFVEQLEFEKGLGARWSESDAHTLQKSSLVHEEDEQEANGDEGVQMEDEAKKVEGVEMEIKSSGARQRVRTDSARDCRK